MDNLRGENSITALCCREGKGIPHCLNSKWSKNFMEEEAAGW